MISMRAWIRFDAQPAENDSTMEEPLCGDAEKIPIPSKVNPILGSFCGERHPMNIE
jgi:hypothetical protein